MDKYDQQAQDFLDKFKITFEYDHIGDILKWGCWRHRFAVVFSRTNRNGERLTLMVTFYGSSLDHQNGRKDLRPYEVLAAISVVQQFCSVKDILDAFGSFKDIDVPGLLSQARAMRHFFTRAALDALDEIQ